MICLEMGLFWFLLIAHLCVSWMCDFVSPQIRGIFLDYFFKQIFYPFPFFFSFLYPCGLTSLLGVHSTWCFGFVLDAPYTPEREPGDLVERRLELLLQENSPKFP